MKYPSAVASCVESGAGAVAAFALPLRLVGPPGEYFEFDQPVQGRDVRDRQSGMVGLVVGAIGLLPAGEARRQQVAGGSDEEQIIGRVATGFDEVGATFELGEVSGDGCGIAADQEQFGLHQHSRRGEFHAPIVELRAAVALSIHDPAGARGVAEATVRGHPVEGRGGADALAVAHLIEPEVVRVLEEGGERLFKERQHRVGRAVAVLNPPGVPGRAFDQAVPTGQVEHGQVLELGIGRQRAARRVEQAQILDIAVPVKERAPELVFVSSGQCQGGNEQQVPGEEWSDGIHRLLVCGCQALRTQEPGRESTIAGGLDSVIAARIQGLTAIPSPSPVSP